MKMKKQQHHVIDKEQFKHYLLDEVKALQNENSKLTQQLNTLQTKYEQLITIQEAAECNGKHLGYLNHNG